MMTRLRSAMIAAMILSVAPQAAADPGRLDAIQRLDKNNDGYIDPEELNDRVRRYLHPIAEARGMRLSRSYSVERWEESIRRYDDDQQRRGSRYRAPDDEAGLRDFRPDYDDPLLPEFGSSDVRYPYSRRDQRSADRALRRYDRNDDGFIDRYEARRGWWSGSPPFESDLNDDGRLSRTELAQRYARQRTEEDQPDRAELLAQRLDNSGDNRDSDPEEWERSSRRGQGSAGSSRTSRYLAYSLMRRYDRNRNGRLEENEWLATGIERGQVDLDRDGDIARDELDAWIYRSMDDRANDLSDVLPEWFYDRDVDADGQISMAEFADEWDDETIQEFERLDADSDGYLTAREMLQAKSVVGGSFASEQAEVLLPRSVTISEIDVQDDIVIGELTLQLSITHTSVRELDAFLIGPDGERVELFTEVGRGGDHFEETIFDDDARSRITRSRAPFNGSYRPEAVDKKDPSLSQFQGRSIRGLWQLMVRATRSDRAGVLHHWALIVEPDPEQETEPEDAEM